MSNKKTSIIAILEVLKYYSDENHPLSVKDIIKYLEVKYQLKVDRRTVYNNIDSLNEFGIDISTFSDNHQGYYINERSLEKSEVFLLCNAIHASNLLPFNGSKQLIEKLLSTQSKFVKDDFKKAVFVENGEKKDNRDFFWNIELISDCIKNKKNIIFYYTKYNLKKEIVKKREEPYIVSPYYLVYAMDKTYLICKSINHDDLLHFRVDKMKDIKASDTKYKKRNKNEDPYQYAKDKIYMYSGASKEIKILCDNSILDDVIDCFGKDITILKNDNDRFIAIVNSSETGMIYYALQYIEHLEILEPKCLRDKVIKYLNIGKDKYQNK